MFSWFLRDVISQTSLENGGCGVSDSSALTQSSLIIQVRKSKQYIVDFCLRKSKRVRRYVDSLGPIINV